MLPSGLTAEQLAAQVARIALIEEEARLDQRLVKVSRRRRMVDRRPPPERVRLSAAARRPRRPVRAATAWAACRRPGPGSRRARRPSRSELPGGDPDVLQHLRGVVVLDGLGAQAVDRHERPVDRADHVGDRDRLGRAGEAPAAGLAALRHHDVGAAQVGEDRLQEAVRDALGLAELLGADRGPVGARPRSRSGPGGRSRPWRKRAYGQFVRYVGQDSQPGRPVRRGRTRVRRPRGARRRRTPRVSGRGRLQLRLVDARRPATGAPA